MFDPKPKCSLQQENVRKTDLPLLLSPTHTQTHSHTWFLTQGSHWKQFDDTHRKEGPRTVYYTISVEMWIAAMTSCNERWRCLQANVPHLPQRVGVFFSCTLKNTENLITPVIQFGQIQTKTHLFCWSSYFLTRTVSSTQVDLVHLRCTSPRVRRQFLVGPWRCPYLSRSPPELKTINAKVLPKTVKQVQGSTLQWCTDWHRMRSNQISCMQKKNCSRGCRYQLNIGHFHGFLLCFNQYIYQSLLRHNWYKKCCTPPQLTFPDLWLTAAHPVGQL